MDRNSIGDERATVLLVDDTPDNLTLMGAVLQDDYKVKVAINGEKALRIARATPPPSLILLDVVMPDVDGYEVCRQLKADTATRDIPVIFLTSLTDTEDEKLGLELGAVDYLSKPASPPILLARVRTQLNLKAASDFLKDKNAFLEGEVDRRTTEVRALQEVTILALASLAETRDTDTGNHLWRTQRYILALAQELKSHPNFRDYLTDTAIMLIFKSAPLHDIGKVGIPDRILMKPGRLDPDEFKVMQSHARLGWNAIDHAEKALGTSVEFLKIAKEITLHHHEKWDGTGYPEGRRGAAIPVPARLMAVADVYDALISRRVYKEGMPHQKAAQIVVEGRGTHFDPDMVDAFLKVQEQFSEIAEQYAD
jgi:putative two-component system response regulator